MADLRDLRDIHKRYSRPQNPSLPVPTASALKRKQPSFPLETKEDRKYGEQQYLREVPEEDLWNEYQDWGSFRQDKGQYIMCSKDDGAAISMFKKHTETSGRSELKALCKLRHINIIHIRESFLMGDTNYLGLEYCRHRLADILSIPLSADHINMIAYSVCPHLRYLSKEKLLIRAKVFEALRYVHSESLIHQSVSVKSARVNHSGKIVLGT